MPDDSKGSKTNPVITRSPGAQVKLSSLSFFFPSTCIYLVSSIIRHGGIEVYTQSRLPELSGNPSDGGADN